MAIFPFHTPSPSWSGPGECPDCKHSAYSTGNLETGFDAWCENCGYKERSRNRTIDRQWWKMSSKNEDGTYEKSLHDVEKLLGVEIKFWRDPCPQCGTPMEGISTNLSSGNRTAFCGPCYTGW